MKETPLIFTGESMKAIITGTKTMTRRTMKPQPHPDFLARGLAGVVPQWPQQDGVRFFMADGSSELVKCPYGGPSSQIWCKETFREFPDGDVYYREYFGDSIPVHADDEPDDWKWTSPIFMPRRLSRITLEIVDVRVQKVTEISYEDAIAEGCVNFGPSLSPAYEHGDDGQCRLAETGEDTARRLRWPQRHYERLWGEINGKKYPWASAPYVFAISFRRVP